MLPTPVYATTLVFRAYCMPEDPDLRAAVEPQFATHFHQFQAAVGGIANSWPLILAALLAAALLSFGWGQLMRLVPKPMMWGSVGLVAALLLVIGGALLYVGFTGDAITEYMGNLSGDNQVWAIVVSEHSGTNSTWAMGWHIPLSLSLCVCVCVRACVCVFYWSDWCGASAGRRHVHHRDGVRAADDERGGGGHRRRRRLRHGHAHDGPGTAHHLRRSHRQTDRQTDSHTHMDESCCVCVVCVAAMVGWAVLWMVTFLYIVSSGEVYGKKVRSQQTKPPKNKSANLVAAALHRTSEPSLCVWCGVVWLVRWRWVCRRTGVRRWRAFTERYTGTAE